MTLSPSRVSQSIIGLEIPILKAGLTYYYRAGNSRPLCGLGGDFLPKRAGSLGNQKHKIQ